MPARRNTFAISGTEQAWHQASHSPVIRVRYKVEDTRVGQKTNYDKLTLEVWTNGTITPEMALVESAKIIGKDGAQMATARADATILIPGKGSGQLKKRVLRFLDQKEIRALYHRVEKDSRNWGRLFIHFRFK